MDVPNNDACANCQNTRKDYGERFANLQSSFLDMKKRVVTTAKLLEVLNLRTQQLADSMKLQKEMETLIVEQKERLKEYLTQSDAKMERATSAEKRCIELSDRIDTMGGELTLARQQVAQLQQEKGKEKEEKKQNWEKRCLTAERQNASLKAEKSEAAKKLAEMTDKLAAQEMELSLIKHELSLKDTSLAPSVCSSGIGSCNTVDLDSIVDDKNDEKMEDILEETAVEADMSSPLMQEEPDPVENQTQYSDSNPSSETNEDVFEILLKAHLPAMLTPIHSPPDLANQDSLNNDIGILSTNQNSSYNNFSVPLANQAPSNNNFYVASTNQNSSSDNFSVPSTNHNPATNTLLWSAPMAKKMTDTEIPAYEKYAAYKSLHETLKIVAEGYRSIFVEGKEPREDRMIEFDARMRAAPESTRSSPQVESLPDTTFSETSSTTSHVSTNQGPASTNRGAAVDDWRRARADTTVASSNPTSLTNSEKYPIVGRVSEKMKLPPASCSSFDPPTKLSKFGDCSVSQKYPIPRVEMSNKQAENVRQLEKDNLNLSKLPNSSKDSEEKLSFAPKPRQKSPAKPPMRTKLIPTVNDYLVDCLKRKSSKTRTSALVVPHISASFQKSEQDSIVSTIDSNSTDVSAPKVDSNSTDFSARKVDSYDVDMSVSKVKKRTSHQGNVEVKKPKVEDVLVKSKKRPAKRRKLLELSEEPNDPDDTEMSVKPGCEISSNELTEKEIVVSEVSGSSEETFRMDEEVILKTEVRSSPSKVDLLESPSNHVISLTAVPSDSMQKTPCSDKVKDLISTFFSINSQESQQTTGDDKLSNISPNNNIVSGTETSLELPINVSDSSLNFSEAHSKAEVSRSIEESNDLRRMSNSELSDSSNSNVTVVILSTTEELPVFPDSHITVTSDAISHRLPVSPVSIRTEESIEPSSEDTGVKTDVEETLKSPVRKPSTSDDDDRELMSSPTLFIVESDDSSPITPRRSKRKCAISSLFSTDDEKSPPKKKVNKKSTIPSSSISPIELPTVTPTEDTLHSDLLNSISPIKSRIISQSTKTYSKKNISNTIPPASVSQSIELTKSLPVNVVVKPVIKLEGVRTPCSFYSTPEATDTKSSESCSLKVEEALRESSCDNVAGSRVGVEERSVEGVGVEYIRGQEVGVGDIRGQETSVKDIRGQGVKVEDIRGQGTSVKDTGGQKACVVDTRGVGMKDIRVQGAVVRDNTGGQGAEEWKSKGYVLKTCYQKLCEGGKKRSEERKKAQEEYNQRNVQGKIVVQATNQLAVLDDATANGSAALADMVEQLCCLEVKNIVPHLLRLLENEDHAGPAEPPPPPPAPHLSPTQRRVVTLVMALGPDAGAAVLAAMQSKICHLGNKTLEDGPMSSYVAVYTALCLARQDLRTLRTLLYDIVYCCKYRAYTIAHQLLTLAPHALPHAYRSKDDLVTQALVCSLLTLKNNKPIVPTSKKDAKMLALLVKTYKYNKDTALTANQIIDEAINRLNSNCVTGVEAALTLLCKRQGWVWAELHLTKHLLLVLSQPCAVPTRRAAARCLAHLARTLPKHRLDVAARTLAALENMMTSTEAEVQETAAYCLIGLSWSKQHRARLVQLLQAWTPRAPPSPALLERITAFMAVEHQASWRWLAKC